jgi:hypothetical protein
MNEEGQPLSRPSSFTPAFRAAIGVPLEFTVRGEGWAVGTLSRSRLSAIRPQRLTTDALALAAPDDRRRDAGELVSALLPHAVVSLP